MDIRKARLKDLPALERIERSSFLAERFPRTLLRSMTEEKDFLTLVAEEDDTVVGYGSVYLALGGAMRLVSLAVVPEERGEGTGRMLLCELEEACRTVKAGRICLEVAVSNLVALRLYITQGYEVKGVIPDYYGKGKDAFYMEKALS